MRTPADIFPNIKIPVVSVVWTYNGLAPDDMSGRIIYYYERTLTSQVADIEHIESQSLNSYGVVKIFFHKNVNIAAAIAQVTAASQTVLKYLPPGITPPYVLSYNASTVPILQLALSSNKLPQRQLFDQGQNFIRPQLATVEGAAIPSPYGGKVLQVQVDIDQPAMQEHNVSAEDVLNAVSAQNLILPAGDQKIGPYDWNVALNASPVVLDHINGLPVKAVNGTVIYIRDVAYVHEGSPPQTNIVRADGTKAVLMTILKSGSVSTLDVIERIKALLPRIKETLPPGINVHAVGDQSIFVRAAIFGVLREAVLAAALVGIMILLFLGSWRSTLIVVISIPLSILFSLTALSWLGETINIMTLGGLALAVGMLVDQGIVTLESIFYHLEQGKDIETAILDGAQQIFVPAFVTLLVLNIVFVPMFNLSGVAGYLFSPLAEFRRLLASCLFRAFVHLSSDDGEVYARRRGQPRPERSQRGRSQPVQYTPPFTQPAQTVPGGVRTPLHAVPRRLPVAAFACSGPAQDLYCRVPRVRHSVVWTAAFPRQELFPNRRFWPDTVACPRADRHPH